MLLLPLDDIEYLHSHTTDDFEIGTVPPRTPDSPGEGSDYLEGPRQIRKSHAFPIL